MTMNQKLKLYKLGVCPRLNWLLTIHQFPMTWVEREQEATSTRYLKSWAGLAKSASPNRLYLSSKEGGLGLPSLSCLYKKLQVSRHSQLLLSADPCVRRIAKVNLILETASQRKKFCPAKIVRTALQMDPSQSRKTVTVAAKSEMTKNDEDRRISEMHSLPYQGCMWWSLDHNSGDIWAQAVQSLPERVFKFALNVAHDTLPHNTNLHIWQKKPTNQCPLCKEDNAEPHTCP